jgi:drug/metabolite transporter (DMT)-like permease
MTNRNPALGVAALLFASASFVTADTLCKIAMEQVPPMQALFLRGVFGSIFCLAALAAMGQLKGFSGLFNRYVAYRALAETFAVVCFFFCLASMDIGDITAIMQTAPLIVIIASAILYGERLPPKLYPLILAGFVGAILVANPGQSGLGWIMLVAFMTPFGAALRDIFARQVPASVHGLVASFAIILLGMVTAGTWHLLAETWTPLTPRLTGYFAGAGLCLLVAQVAIVAAFRLAEARIVAPMLYSFMVWALISGILVFKNQPGLWSYIGAAMIIASGVALTVLQTKGQNPSPIGSRVGVEE